LILASCQPFAMPSAEVTPFGNYHLSTPHWQLSRVSPK
jgi:hypothetical protein